MKKVLVGVANKVDVHINRRADRALLNTGATICIASETFHEKYMSHITNIPLRVHTTK